jgi:alkaline phosphatase
MVVSAQEKIYSTKNAHSHNDYEQQQPFHLAYQENFGSIEADIHLVNGKLYVAHDKINIKEDRTLALLYLDPIKDQLDAIDSIQLLIDIKSDALSTLAALISVLQNYPEIIQSSKIKIVISGNRPDPEQWSTYPDYIYRTTIKKNRTDK